MAGNEFEKAMDKLRDEMARHHEHGALCMIGEHLTELLQREPSRAGKILQDGKTLMGAYKELESYARQQAKGKNGCVVLSDQQGFGIAEKYFGLENEAPEEKAEAIAPPAPAVPAAPLAAAPFALPDLDELLGI